LGSIVARERGRTEEEDDSGQARKTEEADALFLLSRGQNGPYGKTDGGYTPAAGPESIGYVLHGVPVTNFKF